MAQPYFSLGPLTFHFYGIFVLLGLVSVFLYLKINSPRFKINNQDAIQIFSVSLFLALLGARMYHIISSLSYYLTHPQEILKVWNGGLGIFGALLGGFLGIYIACKIKRVNFFYFLNLISPSILVAQAIGRIGNYFNQEGFGPPTFLPWGVYISPINRPFEYLNYSYFHPTFFYESLLCFCAFVFFLYLQKRKNINFGFAYYLVSYGLIRFLTESFRFDTWKIKQLHIGSFLSLIFIIGGVIIFSLANRKSS